MIDNDIISWGFDERFKTLAAQFTDNLPSLTAGRVILQEKGIYRVICEYGEQLATVSGKFRYETSNVSDYPSTGDFVMISPGENGGQATIRHLLPRKSVFIRKAAGTSQSEQVVAANIDTVFLCMSLNNDFNIRRLERYISIAWDSGAIPVVVLTKADLCDNLNEKLAAVRNVSAGIDIIVTSAIETDGYSQILPYLSKGRTVAFVGSSGTGKSTLINCLLGGEQLKTNGLRNDDKGRHTTTHRELLLLSNGAMVIDTPGMRELGMWGSSNGLEKTFEDIENLASKCKFKNCTHRSEPGCAVVLALQNGDLQADRWQSYMKLTAENAYSEDSTSYLASKEKKFKDIAKYNKTNRKK